MLKMGMKGVVEKNARNNRAPGDRAAAKGTNINDNNNRGHMWERSSKWNKNEHLQQLRSQVRERSNQGNIYETTEGAGEQKPRESKWIPETTEVAGEIAAAKEQEKWT